MEINKDSTYIGKIESITGNNIHIRLSSDITSNLSVHKGIVYRIGQVGSFLKVPLGYANLYGIVTQMGASAIPEQLTIDINKTPIEGFQWIVLSLVGEQIGNLFERGVTQFPTVGDKVHMVTIDDLSIIYGDSSNANSVQVGNISVSDSLPAKVDLNKLVTRHCAVIGSTGAGKSNITAVLLDKIAKEERLKKARLLVIDPHGEYVDTFKDDAQVFSTQFTENTDQNNLYLPYWALSFNELVFSFSESALDDQKREYIREKLVEMKKEANREFNIGIEEQKITEDTPIPFSIKKLWFELDDFERRTLTDRADIESRAIKLEGDPVEMRSTVFSPASPGGSSPFINKSAKGILKFLDNMRNKIMNSQYNFLYEPKNYSVTLEELGAGDNGYKSYKIKKPKLDLDDLLQSWIGSDKKITILDLSNVPSEIKSSVSGTILNIIYDALFWGQNLNIGGKKRPILIALEEAHTYLKSGEKSISARITQKIAKEGRKYGCGLLLVTQRPSELDETILSQCGTVIALRLNNSNDKARVASCIQDELQSITNLLPSLKIGEGIVSGEAVRIPSRVKFYKIPYAYKSADPDVVEQWSSDFNEKKEDYKQLVKIWRSQEF